MVTTLNNTAPVRDSGFQSVGFLRRSFTFTDFPTGALEKVVGGLPAGAQIIGGGVVVTTGITGSTPTLSLGYRDYDGTTTSATAYMSAQSVGAAAGMVPFDDIAAATNAPRSVPTQIICTANAALTAGVFDIYVTFIPKNPGSGLGA